MSDSAREGGADLSTGNTKCSHSCLNDSAREGGADLSRNSLDLERHLVRLRPRGRGGFKLLVFS